MKCLTADVLMNPVQRKELCFSLCLVYCNICSLKLSTFSEENSFAFKADIYHTDMKVFHSMGDRGF